MKKPKPQPDPDFHPVSEYVPWPPEKPSREFLRKYTPSIWHKRRGFLREIKKLSQKNLRPSPSSEEIAEALFSIVPDSIAEDFNMDDAEIRVCTADEFVEAFKKSFAANYVKKPSGFKAKLDAAGTAGLYDSLPKDLIRIRENITRTGKWARLWNGPWTYLDVVGHELGHYVDSCCCKVSLKDGFLEVFEKERHMFNWYCSSDPQEFFAEAFWTCCAYPETAEKYIPETKAWFDKFLEYA